MAFNGGEEGLMVYLPQEFEVEVDGGRCGIVFDLLDRSTKA